MSGKRWFISAGEQRYEKILSRFNPDSFIVTYKVEITNPDHVAAAVGGAALPAKINSMAGELRTPLYIDQVLGGRAFFEECSVSIDGVGLEKSPKGMDGYGHLYQAMNRILCSDTLKKELYGGSLSRISNTAERDYTEAAAATAEVVEVVDANNVVTTPAVPARLAVARWLHPNLAKAAECLTHDSTGFTEPLTMRCGFDGQWPFNCQNNALRLHTGQKVENGYGVSP